MKMRETNSTREREVEEFGSSEINLYALYKLILKKDCEQVYII